MMTLFFLGGVGSVVVVVTRLSKDVTLRSCLLYTADSEAPRFDCLRMKKCLFEVPFTFTFVLSRFHNCLIS